MLSPAVGQKKIPLNEYAAHLIEKAATFVPIQLGFNIEFVRAQGVAAPRAN